MLDNSAARARIEHLEQHRDALQEANNRLLFRARNAEGHVERLKDEIALLEKQIQDAHVIIGNLQNDLSIARASHRENLEEACMEIADLRNRLAQHERPD